ncbi:hypothetical protein ACV1DN_09795 [Aeromonas allosaccharophila]
MYLPPSATSIPLVFKTPRRPVFLPAVDAIHFYLGGALRPPLAPAIQSRVASHWQGLARVTDCELVLAEGILRESDLCEALPFGGAVALDHQLQAPLTHATPLDLAQAGGWLQATNLDLRQWQGLAMSQARDQCPVVGSWQQAARPLELASSTPWQQPPARDQTNQTSWHITDLSHRPWELRWDGQPPLLTQLPTRDHLDFALTAATGEWQAMRLVLSLASPQPIRPVAPRDTGHGLPAGYARVADQSDTMPWGVGAKPLDPDWGLDHGDNSGGEIGDRDPPINPKPAPYIIMNEISCVAVNGSERVPLALFNPSLKLDIDSFVWELTGELRGRTNLPYVKPTATGPRHIELTINGWTWLFAVQGYRVNRSLGSEVYPFTARSRTQFLDSPWASLVDVAVPNELSAWQLAAELLTPLGFAIERPAHGEWVQTPDWPLAPGSISERMAPKELLARLAKAAGAVLVPHMSEDKVTVQPRYLVSPWQWATAPDSAFSHLIPEEMLPEESSESASSPRLERVLIAGTTHGVVTEVVRTGTAGSESGEDISDVLAQTHPVNAERGRNLIADSGEQELKTLRLPLMRPGQAPGLVVPGQLVKVLRADGSHTRALCISNALAPSGISSVWQNVTLEVHLDMEA